jgi:hypothetical protein
VTAGRDRADQGRAGGRHCGGRAALLPPDPRKLVRQSVRLARRQGADPLTAARLVADVAGNVKAQLEALVYYHDCAAVDLLLWLDELAIEARAELDRAPRQ